MKHILSVNYDKSYGSKNISSFSRNGDTITFDEFAQFTRNKIQRRVSSSQASNSVSNRRNSLNNTTYEFSSYGGGDYYGVTFFFGETNVKYVGRGTFVSGDYTGTYKRFGDVVALNFPSYGAFKATLLANSLTIDASPRSFHSGLVLEKKPQW